MEDLGKILGQDQIIEKVFAQFKSGAQTHLFQGPSGTGKSFTALDLSRRWAEKKSQNNSYYLFCSEANSKSPLYPFKRLFISKESTPFSKITASVPSEEDSLGNLLHSLASTLPNEKQEKESPFNTPESEILYHLEFISRNYSALLVLDDFQWWDDFSLIFLNKILAPSTQKSFPFLSNLQFLICRNPDEAISGSLLEAKLAKKFKDSGTQFSPPALRLFPQLLKAFGFKGDINPKTLKVLEVSGGSHLELIKRLATVLKDGIFQDEPDLNEKAEQVQYLLHKTIEYKLNSLGGDRAGFEDFLNQTAFLGMQLNLHEIQCLTESNSLIIDKWVDKGKELGFIGERAGQAFFVHEIIREFFEFKAKSRKGEFHFKLGECLSLIKPHDYFLRAYHFAQAGDLKLASAYWISGELKGGREGLDFSSDQIEKVTFYAKHAGFEDFLKDIRKASQLMKEGKYLECIALLEGMEIYQSKNLSFEKDFLLVIAYAKYWDKTTIEKALDLLEFWVGDRKEFEPEQWVRIASSLISFYTRIKETRKARHLEKQLLFFLAERAEYDEESKVGMHIIKRKAAAIYETEIATKRTLEAVTFFSSEDGYAVKYPIQYFMALVNHSGNLIVSGKFENSSTFGTKAVQFERNFANLSIPNRERATNNLIVSAYFHGTISASQAVEIFKKLEGGPSAAGDRLLYTNNLGCLYILNGEIEKGTALLQDAIEKMKRKQIEDEYYQLFFQSNFGMAQLMQGNPQVFLAIYSVLDKEVRKVEFAGKKHLIKRIELFLENYKEAPGFQPEDWNNVLFTKLDHYLSESWKYWGKAFLLSDIQYWVEA